MNRVNPTIYLGDRPIGLDHPPYFIAEIGSNHEGSLSRAKHLIDLAKESGADAVKFQHFTANTLVSREGFKYLPQLQTHQSNWSQDVFETYKSAETPVDWIPILSAYAKQVDINFLSTPYNVDSLDELDKHSNCFKIGSGDITWPDFIGTVAALGKPLLIATGGASFNDVVRAVSSVRQHNGQCILMQCNTNYTNRADNITFYNLNVLNSFRRSFPECVLGLSDHTQTDLVTLSSVALGARIIEKHFTDDVNRIGPDHYFAIDPPSWKLMVTRCLDVYLSLGDGLKRIEENEVDSIIVQQRCVRASRKLEKGHIVTNADLIYLRPCPIGSIKPFQKDKIIGRRLTANVDFHHSFKFSDFEPNF